MRPVQRGQLARRVAPAAGVGRWRDALAGLAHLPRHAVGRAAALPARARVCTAVALRAQHQPRAPGANQPVGNAPPRRRRRRRRHAGALAARAAGRVHRRGAGRRVDRRVSARPRRALLQPAAPAGRHRRPAPGPCLLRHLAGPGDARAGPARPIDGSGAVIPTLTTQAGAPPGWRLAAYGLLGLPLAMAALPVYVQVAAYYNLVRGVALAQLGWVLFAARLFDTLQDPLLGHAIDRLRGGMARWLSLGATMLALGFAGLWMAPASGVSAALWLGVMLVLAYSAHSMLNIAYLAWGARLSGAAADAGASAPLLSAAAWREGAGLAGMLIAS